MTAALRLLQAARDGQLDRVREADEHVVRDAVEPNTGWTALHWAAAGGHDECCEALLERGASVTAVSKAGQTPLHVAAQSATPMCTYQLACRAPAACLARDAQQQTPIQLAAATEKGEVLNAMLLACCGHNSEESLSAMQMLLQAGAVCDTWAPNGSSALMLAASADCAEGVQLLLGNSATMELQDALGRTALMFSAGNNAVAALERLLDNGASVSIRDRRGRAVLDYAAEGSEARRVLVQRIQEMERKAARLQEELLAELEQDGKAASKTTGKKGKRAKKLKQQQSATGKQAGLARPAHETAPAEEAQEQAAEPTSCTQQPDSTQKSPPGGVPSEGDPDGGPDWQVVGKHQRHHGRHRRWPSISSDLGSSCSGESHETGGSNLSQRSVLIHRSSSRPSSSMAAVTGKAKLPSAQAAEALGSAAPLKPAWGKVVKLAPVTTPAAAAAGPAFNHQAQQPQQQQQQQEPACTAADTLQQPPPLEQTRLPQQKVAFSTSEGCVDSSTEKPATQASGAGMPDSAPGSVAEPLIAAREAALLASELTALRVEVARLQLQQRQQQELHQGELAAVLADTAAHEAAAVAQAVAAERMQCIYRFAAFLQNNNLAADLLSMHGLAPAGGTLPAEVWGFPPLDSRRAAAATTPGLSFADSLEKQLRTEFSGNVSRFLVPATTELGPPMDM